LAAMDWTDVITRFIVPPILGGAGGLIAIYANWGIEKSRQRLARRRDLVTGWRMNIIPMFQDRDVDWLELKPRLIVSPFYASLRPHLSDDAVRMIYTERTAYAGEDVFLKLFTSEIGRVERKWKLV
jgi:hypothetical protein